MYIGSDALVERRLITLNKSDRLCDDEVVLGKVGYVKLILRLLAEFIHAGHLSYLGGRQPLPSNTL